MSPLDANGLSVDYSGYIATYSGQIIEPLNPDPGAIMIEDIAHSLSQQCRFTGHTKMFYSVGQHSVLASGYVEDEKYRLWALLHDATEAYLADMARPIKHQPGFGDVYRKAEDLLMKAIIDRFGLTDERPMPEAVQKIDNLLLGAEIKLLMPSHVIFEGWEMSSKLSKYDFEEWTPMETEAEFLAIYTELGGSYVSS